MQTIVSLVAAEMGVAIVASMQNFQRSGVVYKALSEYLHCGDRPNLAQRSNGRGAAVFGSRQTNQRIVDCRF